ncbi:hemerythrin family protein [Dechloromonas sp. XY25]|uniref:Hemerythrin family protein n=1 Tax=Dechloromonas hankyongensis TaxID=2908002 RepID=A0ABS9K4F0_9RHOO|nr:hemerythrin family protein [Dechloromonas hankyongensis]MCG2578056.1 hemerythrin family protein [Dechloromonas hankyongensis]
MNKNLLLGAPHIDHQHSELFHSFQRLLSIAPGEEAIADALSRLTNLIHEHFQSEEKFMAGINMPDVEMLDHVKAHGQIIEDLTAIHLETMFGMGVPFEEIVNRASIYVNQHIIEFDLGLKAYIGKQ